MALLSYDVPRQPAWPVRLLVAMGILDTQKPAEPATDLNTLSDGQLRDIGVERTDIAQIMERELAALRRHGGAGPFV